jgi:hypothetical protein
VQRRVVLPFARQEARPAAAAGAIRFRPGRRAARGEAANDRRAHLDAGRAREAVAHDVLAVLRLGRLVRHDGYLSRSGPPFRRHPGGSGLQHDAVGHDRRAVLHRDGGRPLLRGGAGARRDASARRGIAVSRLSRRDACGVLLGTAGLRLLLQPHARPRERGRLQPDGEPGKAVSRRPRLRHHRLDRGGPHRGHARCRGNSHAVAARGARLARIRGLRLPAAPHAAEVARAQGERA